MVERKGMRQALFNTGIEADLPNLLPSQHRQLTPESVKLSIELAKSYLVDGISYEELSKTHYLSPSRISQRVNGVLLKFYNNLPVEERKKYKNLFPRF